MVDAAGVRPAQRSNANGITISSPGPGIVLVTMRGHARSDAVPSALYEIAQIVKGNAGFHYFYDLWDLAVYDSPVRVDMTHYHRTVGLRSLHTLTRSRIVAMGVAVANLALGNRITVHSNRESFDQRLDALCREAAR